MISFSNEQMPECEYLDGGREDNREPRAVGQFMAAVLARYGISANAEPERPRLPRLEHRPAQLGGLLSVG